MRDSRSIDIGGSLHTNLTNRKSIKGEGIGRREGLL